MPRHSHSGVLVVLDGIDGAGKSTQVQLLQDQLAGLGIPFIASKEPTNGKYGRRLRDSATLGRLAPEEELETFLADRREHVETLILPSLQDGRVVILDRYYFSTAAYQGARGLDWRQILQRNEEFAPEPDRLFILDLTPEVGVERINSRDGVGNHFEGIADLEKSRAIFQQLSGPYIRWLNATRSREELSQSILESVLWALTAKILANPSMDSSGKLEKILRWSQPPASRQS
jgi:dTMP kinase